MSEERFYRNYEAGTVPSYLLDSMFSLSARFCQAAEILSRGIEGSYFSQKAVAEMDLIRESSDTVCIAEVTAAYLLAFHGFADAPSRKAAEYGSKAVRMAYMADLHQIDNTNQTIGTTNLTSDLETEEKRCLWWGLFVLDTFSSLISFTPANIEDLSISSCLPTTIVSQTSLQHLYNPRQAFLSEEASTIWDAIRQNEPVTARTQAVLIYVTAIAKEMAAIRRIRLQNPRHNPSAAVETLRQKWDQLLSTLPAWFLDPHRHALEDVDDNYHKRLETVIMIHT